MLPTIRSGGIRYASAAFWTGNLHRMEAFQGEAMSDEKLMAVVLHYPDYRGDHSADAEDAILLPESTTLADLQKRADAASSYGSAWIRINGRKP